MCPIRRFANSLQVAVKGVVAPDAPLVEVNQALRSLFSGFRMSDNPGDGLCDGIYIEPWLLADAVPHGGDWPKLVSGPPPVTLPEAIAPDAQESWHLSLRRAAPFA